MVWLPVFGIFNVRTDVDACSLHGGCTDTVIRESALEADSRTKIHCRIWDSNPRQYCAWLFIRALYQLRIPVAVLGQTTKRCHTNICSGPNDQEVSHTKKVLGQTTKRYHTNICSGPNDQEVSHKHLFWAKRPRGVTQTFVLGQTTKRCHTNICSGPNDQEVSHKHLFWAKRPRDVTQTAVLGQTTKRCYTNSFRVAEEQAAGLAVRCGRMCRLTEPLTRITG